VGCVGGQEREHCDGEIVDFRGQVTVQDGRDITLRDGVLPRTDGRVKNALVTGGGDTRAGSTSENMGEAVDGGCNIVEYGGGGGDIVATTSIIVHFVGSGGGDVPEEAGGVDAPSNFHSVGTDTCDGETVVALPSVRRKSITCNLCGSELVGGQGQLTRHLRNNCPGKSDFDSSTMGVRRRSKSSDTPVLNILPGVQAPLGSATSYVAGRPPPSGTPSRTSPAQTRVSLGRHFKFFILL